MSATMNSRMFADYFSSSPCPSAAPVSTHTHHDAGWGDDDDGVNDHGWGSGSSSSSSSPYGGAAAATQEQKPPSIAPIVEIPGFTHPVAQFFLEDAVEW